MREEIVSERKRNMSKIQDVVTKLRVIGTKVLICVERVENWCDLRTVRLIRGDCRKISHVVCATLTIELPFQMSSIWKDG